MKKVGLVFVAVEEGFDIHRVFAGGLNAVEKEEGVVLTEEGKGRFANIERRI